ncbi:hypothetical protein VTK73DRAFT_6996 [Phialemonium thermophilum]|uniref:Uncharacterized protein n=1 Tax=Phialemonium thermophilum TaxID=223376 RepID=A0ABR3WH38_9PEZI
MLTREASDALAEFHLPRSGIEDAVEHMRFPNFHSQVAGRSEMLFLAFFSVRRLLNRIHNAVYASRSSPRLDVPSYATIQSLESVLTELIRQLASWYHSLTDTIRPDFASAPADMHDTWLRLRYWSAKHIATRPCLLYAVSVDAATDLPPFVMEYSEMCLQSCRNYLQTAVYALRERTPYNWMTVQASLATALVLTIASASAAVQHLVLDLEDLLTEAIAALQPWTSGDPSASMVKMILETLLQKQRLQIAGIV